MTLAKKTSSKKKTSADKIVELIEETVAVKSEETVVAKPVRTKSEARPLTIPELVVEAFTKGKIAAGLGFAFGGFVPVSVYIISHYEIGEGFGPLMLAKWFIVLAALVYSAKTVYDWSLLAFDNVAKAVGFTVLLEGVMTVSSTEWLSRTALFYLIFINGVAAAVQVNKRRT